MVLSEKETLILKLKLAENADRHKDMLEAVNSLAQNYPEFLVKEGQLVQPRFSD